MFALSSKRASVFNHLDVSNLSDRIVVSVRETPKVQTLFLSKKMMTKTGILACILACLSASSIAKPQVKTKDVIHSFQISSLYWHLNDPDWDNVWKRRNLIPEYQLSYKRYFVKARFFTLAPFERGNDGDIFNLTSEYVNGEEKVKDGAIIVRSYKTLDFVSGIRIPALQITTLQIGVGVSHRNGEETVGRRLNSSVVPDVSDNYIQSVNEWGGICEVDYSISFLKYLTSSLEIGYRFYPKSTGMLTFGIGVGVQIDHNLPFQSRKKGVE